jgi:hypothetical protein
VFCRTRTLAYRALPAVSTTVCFANARSKPRRRLSHGPGSPARDVCRLAVRAPARRQTVAAMPPCARGARWSRSTAPWRPAGFKPARAARRVRAPRRPDSGPCESARGAWPARGPCLIPRGVGALRVERRARGYKPRCGGPPARAGPS